MLEAAVPATVELRQLLRACQDWGMRRRRDRGKPKVKGGVDDA